MCSREAEDLAGVDADALEDAVAVEQAVVVDADLGVGLVEELAVDVDLWGSWRPHTSSRSRSPRAGDRRVSTPGRFLDPARDEPDDAIGLGDDVRGCASP